VSPTPARAEGDFEAAASQIRALAPESRREHILALTGLRFVPALMVVVSHLPHLPNAGPIAVRSRAP
jgi:hypothetical protein